MTYEEAFEFLDRTAKGIAQMFGSSCETLVHDMSVPDHPILSIYNGHVSGREVGSTMDIMGVGQDLDEEARRPISSTSMPPRLPVSRSKAPPFT